MRTSLTPSRTASEDAAPDAPKDPMIPTVLPLKRQTEAACSVTARRQSTMARSNIQRCTSNWRTKAQDQHEGVLGRFEGPGDGHVAHQDAFALHYLDVDAVVVAHSVLSTQAGRGIDSEYGAGALMRAMLTIRMTAPPLPATSRQARRHGN